MSAVYWIRVGDRVVTGFRYPTMTVDAKGHQREAPFIPDPLLGEIRTAPKCIAQTSKDAPPFLWTIHASAAFTASCIEGAEVVCEERAEEKTKRRRKT